MLASSIEWILVASGAITAGAGLAALLFPYLFLRLGFELEGAASSTVFFVRHWGVLLSAVGALIVCSAFVPVVRVPVLAAAAIEKFAIGFFVFFGPMKRTSVMTAIALGDGAFALIYAAYLAGV